MPRRRRSSASNWPGRFRDGAHHRQHARSGGSRAGDQAADARRRVHVPLIGDFHYNGHVLLTKHPDCARSARQIPHQSRQRRQRQAARRAVRDDLQSRARQWQAGAHRRQRRLAQPRAGDAQMQENTDQTSARPPRRSSTSAWCSRRCNRPNSRSNRACARTRSSSRARFRGRAISSESIAIWRPRRPAAASGPHRSGHGLKGIVWSSAAMGILLAEGIGDTIRVSLTPRPGGDRRERFTRRARSSSRSDCARSPERHCLSGLRPHDDHHVPGTRRAHSGLHSHICPNGSTLRRRRRDEARRDGLHRQRPRRIEGREHRHRLPGTGETPHCPVYIDGQKFTTLKARTTSSRLRFRR